MASKRQRVGSPGAELQDGSELQKHLDMCLRLERPLQPADLIFLLDCCLVVWENRMETQLQALRDDLLNTLLRLCRELVRHFKNPLWRSYNLTLTGIVGTIRGSVCYEVKRLRWLNSKMNLPKLAKYSQSLVFNADFLPFIRTGLALQGFVDVIASDPDLSTVETAHLIHLAQGLVEGRCGAGFNSVHLVTWLQFLEVIFSNAQPVDDWKIVIQPLSLFLSLLSGPSGLPGTSGLNKNFLLFSTMFGSLSFPAMLKTTRALFSSSIMDAKQIRRLTAAACCSISARACFGPLTIDKESLQEMKLLRYDLYVSGGKVSFDSLLTTDSVVKMQMVAGVLRLYVRIVQLIAPRIPLPEVLAKNEKKTAGKWLDDLRDQTMNATFAEGEPEAVAEEHERVQLAIEFALLLTENPTFRSENEI